MSTTFTELLHAIKVINTRGDLEQTVSGISYDAFTVAPGELFLATEGVNFDRHDYIAEVTNRGIKAVVHSRPLDGYRDDVAYVQVENVQRSMSPISAAFYGHPSRKLAVVGVTGTNGKSTTVNFIYQLIGLLGRRAGILSSVTFDYGKGLSRNPHHASTPEATAVQRHLSLAVENGVEYMVLEATSHALSDRNNRVGDVCFDAAVMTNVTHEHLEFHGSMEQYLYDKANLFRLMDALGGDAAFGVVNRDDPSYVAFAETSAKPIYTYGIDNPSDIQASSIRGSANRSTFAIKHRDGEADCTIPFPGRFNVSNALAAIVTVSTLLHAPIREVADLCAELSPITGRMSVVDAGQPFTVIVDFAHTPDSFAKLLPEARANTRGKVIVVFGSAGERDTKKRPLQGKIASEHADIVVLADEDPRGEDSISILTEIADGCEGLAPGKELFLIPDRQAAISQAMSLAGEGDTVMLLGKGHETSIAYADGDIPWDEESAARECLKSIGYG